MAKKNAQDIRKAVTDQMITAIENGVSPWRKPWSGKSMLGSPCNFASGHRYSGINPLILMMQGRESKHWGSVKAWMEHVGAHVSRGQKCTMITLYKMIPKRNAETKKVEYNKNGEQVVFPMLKQFPVFNAEQVQPPDVKSLLDGRCQSGRGSFVKALLGINDKKARTSQTTQKELLEIASRYVPKNEQPDSKATREAIASLIHESIKARLQKYLSQEGEKRNDDPDYEPAEQLLKASGATIYHGGNRAFYRRRPDDFIKVPQKSQFDSIANYYDTVFHELIHWTEDKSRVGQKEGHKYAFGELVAEIGACYLMLELSVPASSEILKNSQSYVGSWLKGMNDDPKFIFDASAQASKAVDYLLTLNKQKSAA